MWNGRPISSFFLIIKHLSNVQQFLLLYDSLFGLTHIWPKSVHQCCQYIFYGTLNDQNAILN